jgi:hypothetical protein
MSAAKSSRRPTPQRVLLDTNVWSMLGRTGSGAAFYALTREMGFEVVVAPSILLEIARSSNVEASACDRAAVLAGQRRHLPSEAELVTTELLDELRRLHPEWLLKKPDNRRWKELHRFWTIELWRRARRDWSAVVEAVVDAPTDDLEQVRIDQAKLKSEMLDLKINVPAARGQIKPEGPRWFVEALPEDGWVDLWRFESWHLWRKVLLEIARPVLRDGTVRSLADWLEGFVDVPAIMRDMRAFTKFWFAEVKARRMPSQWLSFTAQRYQMVSKVTESSPFDAQHAGYLPECDLFLTADRRLVMTIESIARDAPFDVATVLRISGRDDTVIAEIRSVLSARGSHTTPPAPRNRCPDHGRKDVREP